MNERVSREFNSEPKESIFAIRRVDTTIKYPLQCDYVLRLTIDASIATSWGDHLLIRKVSSGKMMLVDASGVPLRKFNLSREPWTVPLTYVTWRNYVVVRYCGCQKVFDSFGIEISWTKWLNGIVVVWKDRLTNVSSHGVRTFRMDGGSLYISHTMYFAPQTEFHIPMFATVFENNLVVAFRGGTIVRYSHMLVEMDRARVPITSTIECLLEYRHYLVSSHSNALLIWNRNLRVIQTIGGYNLRDMVVWDGHLVSKSGGTYFLWKKLVWSPELHAIYPEVVRNSIRTFLLSSRILRGGRISKDILRLIICEIADDWDDKTPS